MRECDILYENGSFIVLRAAKGFEVYQQGLTHASRVATIGYGGQEGLNRAKAEADKRAASVSLQQHQGG